MRKSELEAENTRLADRLALMLMNSEDSRKKAREASNAIEHLEEELREYRTKPGGVFIDEKPVMALINAALADRIEKELNYASHNNAMTSIIGEVIKEKQEALKEKIGGILDEVFSGKEFDEELRKQARQKIARGCLSAFDRYIDGVVGNIKKDTVLRGKMINALHRVIADYASNSTEKE